MRPAQGLSSVNGAPNFWADWRRRPDAEGLCRLRPSGLAGGTAPFGHGTDRSRRQSCLVLRAARERAAVRVLPRRHSMSEATVSRSVRGKAENYLGMSRGMLRLTLMPLLKRHVDLVMRRWVPSTCQSCSGCQVPSCRADSCSKSQLRLGKPNQQSQKAQ